MSPTDTAPVALSAIEELPGSEALAARRRRALDRLADVPVPSPELEEWRYSPIDELDVDAHRPVTSRPSGDPAPILPEPVAGAAARLVLVDGFVAHVELGDSAAGVRIAVVDDETVDAPGSVVGVDADHFTVLAEAFSPEPVIVDVAASTVLDGPLVIDAVTSARPHPHLVAPRVLIRVGRDAEIAVVERHTGADASPALVASVTEIEVGDAARCRHLWLGLGGDESWTVSTVAARVGRDATFVGGGVGFGGRYARLRNVTRLVGRGATGDLRGLYVARGTQVLDFRTFHHHEAPDTNANLVFKGVVDDAARSIYTGLIHIAHEGRNADAHQTNRVVKLSDDAFADSVPNLEIENNEVRCSHASAVGPIDADQRFYIESRAVPPDEAELLVVRGFLADLVTELPVAEIRPLVESLVDAALGARSAPTTPEAER